MIPPFAQAQIQRQVRQLLASNAANALTVTLHWRTRTYEPGYDPGDEDTHTLAEATARSLSFRAFVHTIDHRNSAYQRFMELDTGVVMLDYVDDLELDGKEDCRFEIDGRFYVQKSVGKELLEMWSTHNDEYGGVLRTIALIPAS